MTRREDEPLETNKVLMATGFTRMFGDSLNNRFNNLLVSTVGATVNQMGFLQGGKSLFGNLTQLLFGRLADRYGKKRFIAAGQIINGFAILALLYFTTPEWLIAMVLLSSFSVSMSRPGWSSLLGDYTDERNRGKIIGAINSISQMGSFVAMLVAFAMTINQTGDTTRESYLPVLAVAAGASFLGGIMVLFTDEKPPKGVSLALDIKRLFKDPRLTRYLLLNFIYGMGMSFAWPLFPYVITDKLKMKIWQVATLSLSSSAVSVLAQRRLGTFMDKVGRRPIIVLSRTLMAVAPIAYALAAQWWHITIAELFLGVGMAAWMSSEGTYVIDLAPRDLRATYLASSTTAFGIATFIGSNFAGYVVENFLSTTGFTGINQGLLISAGLRVIFGLAYLTVYETKKPPE
ncbi:MAG: MFS transporter [Candidatus Bathyarchaeota archaeon]|nr:MFS transporter [Candidatus Bathyarchaeota archaeon]